jgi:hypothetical protein
MNTSAKILVAALMMAGTTVALSAPANAGFGVSMGIGGPGWNGYYEDNRPCWWYREYDLPAPYRCYDYFYGIWGSDIYNDEGFIFRDRDDWWRWHDREDYRHWRAHDFRWHGTSGHSDRSDWNGGHDRGDGGGSANWGGSQRGQSDSRGGTTNWNSRDDHASTIHGNNYDHRGHGGGHTNRGGHADRGGNGIGHGDWRRGGHDRGDDHR